MLPGPGPDGSLWIGTLSGVPELFCSKIRCPYPDRMSRSGHAADARDRSTPLVKIGHLRVLQEWPSTCTHSHER